VDLTVPISPVELRKVLDAKDRGWAELDPPELWKLVEGIGPISGVNKTKLQGVKTVLQSPVVFEDWRVFEKTVNALSGRPPDFRIVEPPSYPDLVYGVRVMEELLGGPPPLSDDILKYCAAVAMLRNAPSLPGVLKGGEQFMYVRGTDFSQVSDAFARSMPDKQVGA
jgi:hypothetical protein